MTDKKTALPPPVPAESNNSPEETSNPHPSDLRKVMLATPVFNESCEMFYVHSLCESAKALLVNGIALTQVLYSAADGRHMAINQAITDAWSNGFDGLAIVSSDVNWEPQALYELITTNKDCAAIPVASEHGLNVTVGEISRLQQDLPSGEIKVQSTTADFIYFSPYALSRLCSTHHSISYMGKDVKVIVDSGDSFGFWAEENEILRSKLSELNIEMWVIPDYTARTRRLQFFAGDFSAELAKLK
jgi:hypothetical protein